jgi:periplasmic protein TonB
MFNVLSGERKRRIISPATIAASVAAHLLLLGGAVYAAASDPGPTEVVGLGIDLPPLPEAPVEVKKVEVPPPPPVQPARPAARVVAGATLQIETPDDVPEDIKPEPPGLAPVDVRDYTGQGPVGNVIGKPPVQPTTVPVGPRPVTRAPDFIPDESMVEERPSLLRDGLASTLERYYPTHLRDSHTNGRAVVELIVDENGRVRENSARVVEATHQAFGDAALRAVQRFRFRPARMGGVAVPVRVTIPINWQVPR